MSCREAGSAVSRRVDILSTTPSQGNDLYGGSNRLLTYLKTSGGHPVHHIDTTQPDLLLPLLQKPNSKIRYVLLESPTNPLLQIVDIETISNMVHRYIPEAIVIVDNTMMSPFLQRPLELGADVVYDSATKYLSGHHDLMAGAIYCNREDVAQVSFSVLVLWFVSSLALFLIRRLYSSRNSIWLSQSIPSAMAYRLSTPSFFYEASRLWLSEWNDKSAQHV